jgi:hypothetical protein
MHEMGCDLLSKLERERFLLKKLERAGEREVFIVMTIKK